MPMKQRPRMPWVYAGSHNFTRSAWGALEKNESQFRVNNYECGVVLLPKNYVDWYNGDVKSSSKGDSSERCGKGDSDSKDDGCDLKDDSCDPKDNNHDLKDNYNPEDDFCNPIDLPFETPCLPYHDSDAPFCVDWTVCDKHGNECS